ncbi:hypothetical protein KJ359_005374 [Pestalotiopsis sp. 9143b]|nr:hypothetical protein KJ359_005374 [Pestalotiopsis sp. 9143b]
MADVVEFANSLAVELELVVMLVSIGPLDRRLLRTSPEFVEDTLSAVSEKKLERFEADEFVGELVEFAKAAVVVSVVTTVEILVTVAVSTLLTVLVVIGVDAVTVVCCTPRQLHALE